MNHLLESFLRSFTISFIATLIVLPLILLWMHHRVMKTLEVSEVHPTKITPPYTYQYKGLEGRLVQSYWEILTGTVKYRAYSCIDVRDNTWITRQGVMCSPEDKLLFTEAVKFWRTQLESGVGQKSKEKIWQLD